GPLRNSLETLTLGLVLQDALLPRDVANVRQRFHGLRVFIDSSIAFAALDLVGVANGVAAREGLGLLREAGATVCIFECTVFEMQRILAVYEERVGTPQGTMSLHPTDLT